MSSILGAILEAKEKRIAEGRLDFPLAPQPRGNGAAFLEALGRRPRPGDGRPAVIAEIKHRSPSAGEILPRAEERIEEIARAYRRGGAAALSVVIEHDFFGGNPDFLPRAKAASGLPALMKDFVVSETQLNLAVALGADAVLLIVSALDDGTLVRLHRAAEARGLAVLVEAHDEEEIGRAAAAGARIVGINARDLRTFRADLERMGALSALLPTDVVRVAESGIRTNADLERLAGFDAFLVGESLLRDPDPCAGLRRLRGESPVHVKICGLTRAADVDACVREGVDELGFNFSPRSPRRVSLETARSLADRSGGLGVVAVFSGNRKAEIEDVAAMLRPTAVQLTEEPPEGLTLPEGTQLWRTVRVGRDDLAAAATWPCDLLLFDSAPGGTSGGTGKTFDWNAISGSVRERRFAVAGGLVPANVGDAIRMARPFAVDVASGVESAPGEKDATRIAEFVKTVRGTRVEKE